MVATMAGQSLRATVDALRAAIAVAGYEAVLAAEERRQLPIV